MKKVISLILAVLMLVSLPTAMYANENDPDSGITPYWDNMDLIEVGLSFNGTSGTATVTVDRVFGITTSIEGTLTVYKKVGNDWVYVDSTSGTSTRQLNLDLTFTGSKGTTYKAVADITANGTGGSESASVEKEKTC